MDTSPMSRCFSRKSFTLLLLVVLVLVFVYQKVLIKLHMDSEKINRNEFLQLRRNERTFEEHFDKIYNHSVVETPLDGSKILPNVVGKTIRNGIFQDNSEFKYTRKVNNVAEQVIENNFPKPVIFDVSLNSDHIEIGKSIPENVINNKLPVSSENHTSKDVNTLTTLASMNFRVYNVTEYDILTFTETSCDSIFPKILLFNRIFKTGSTSVSFYIKDTLSGSNVAFYEGTTEDWYKKDDSYPYPELIEYLASKNESSVFNAHFFFRKNLHIGKSYTYINILRNPVDRVISHYRYMRNPLLRMAHRIKELKESGLWNETISDCLKNQHRGCEDNVMTRFFCGTKSYCKRGSKKALKRAKFNMNRFYASIGIYEKLDLTLKIFKRRLPNFFVHPDNKNVVLQNEKSNTAKSNFNKTVRNYIASRNKADIRLYKYAKKIFNTQLKKCGL